MTIAALILAFLGCSTGVLGLFIGFKAHDKINELDQAVVDLVRQDIKFKTPTQRSTVDTPTQEIPAIGSIGHRQRTRPQIGLYHDQTVEDIYRGLFGENTDV